MFSKLKPYLRDPRVLMLLVLALALTVVCGVKMYDAVWGTPQLQAPDVPAAAFIDHTIPPLVSSEGLATVRIPVAADRQALIVTHAVLASLLAGKATVTSLRRVGLSAGQSRLLVTTFGQTVNGSVGSLGLSSVSGALATYTGSFGAVTSARRQSGSVVAVFAARGNWAGVKLVSLTVQISLS